MKDASRHVSRTTNWETQIVEKVTEHILHGMGDKSPGRAAAAAMEALSEVTA